MINPTTLLEPSTPTSYTLQEYTGTSLNEDQKSSLFWSLIAGVRPTIQYNTIKLY